MQWRLLNIKIDEIYYSILERKLNDNFYPQRMSDLTQTRRYYKNNPYKIFCLLYLNIINIQIKINPIFIFYYKVSFFFQYLVAIAYNIIVSYAKLKDIYVLLFSYFYKHKLRLTQTFWLSRVEFRKIWKVEKNYLNRKQFNGNNAYSNFLT